MRVTLLPVMVALVIILAMIPAIKLTAAAPCNDIASVDFANRRFDMPNYGPITMKNGKASLPFFPDEPQQTEWEVTLEEEIVFKPSQEVSLRLVRLNQDHIAGTGSADYVLVYACREGQLERIYQSQSYEGGATIKKIGENVFTVSYGVWLQTDSHASPSMQNTDTYQWSPAKGTFMLVKRVLSKFEIEE